MDARPVSPSAPLPAAVAAADAVIAQLRRFQDSGLLLPEGFPAEGAEQFAMTLDAVVKHHPSGPRPASIPRYCRAAACLMAVVARFASDGKMPAGAPSEAPHLARHARRALRLCEHAAAAAAPEGA